MVLVIAAVATVLNAKCGKPLDDSTMLALLGMAASYIIGQGVADAGSQGTAREAAKAIKQGGAAGRAILRALGKQGKPGPSENPAKVEVTKPEPDKGSAA